MTPFWRRARVDCPGAGFPAEEVVGAVDRIINTYLDLRETPEERFIDAYRRLGMAPFKAALYQAVSHA